MGFTSIQRKNLKSQLWGKGLEEPTNSCSKINKLKSQPYPTKKTEYIFILTYSKYSIYKYVFHPGLPKISVHFCKFSSERCRWRLDPFLMFVLSFLSLTNHANFMCYLLLDKGSKSHTLNINKAPHGHEYEYRHVGTPTYKWSTKEKITPKQQRGWLHQVLPKKENLLS